MPTPSNISPFDPTTEAAIKCSVVFEIAYALPARGNAPLVIRSQNPNATPVDLLRILLVGKNGISGVVGVTTSEGAQVDIPVRLVFANEQA
jgi:hypothetical protein